MNNRKTPTAGTNVLSMTCAAICLALCLVLPFLTGQIPQIGNMLCPMHFPVLLCGLICGPFYAAAVGVMAPLLRFALFGMPVIFPTGAAMCFELMTYGVVSSLVYRALPRKPISLYAALIAAMLAGRAVWGVVSFILRGIAGTGFTWSAFMAGAFTTAVPGIIIQLVLIPVIVMALERALPGLARN